MIPRYSRSGYCQLCERELSTMRISWFQSQYPICISWVESPPHPGIYHSFDAQTLAACPRLWYPAQLNLAAPPWPIGTFLGRHWLTLFQFHPAAAHPVRDGEGRRQWCSPKLNPNNYFRVSIIISKQNSYIKLYASAGATPPSSSSPPSLTSMSRCAGCDQCHVWQCRDTPRDNISPRARDNGDRWRSWWREMCRSSCLHRRHHEAINLIKAADTKISRYSHLHNPHKVRLDTLTIWKLSCYPCNGHLSWPGKIDVATSYLCVDIEIDNRYLNHAKDQMSRNENTTNQG